MTRKRRHPAPWPLDKLLAADRSAGTVFLALVALAGGKRQVNCTRARITEVTRLHRSTITKAITALHDALWITRRRGHAVNRRWYRITLNVESAFPWTVKSGLRARRKPVAPRAVKTVPSAGSKEHENRPKRARRLGRENRPNSLEGVGDALQPSPLVPTGAGTAGIAQHAAQDTVRKQECDGPLIPIADALGLNKPPTRGGRKHA